MCKQIHFYCKDFMMLKSDPKVKKTLVRNCENKVAKSCVVRDANSSKNMPNISPTKINKLNQPTLCSSEVLAQYIAEAKICHPPPPTKEDISSINVKVRKTLNFHFNDRIYRNLIELNTNIEELKKKKEKRPTSSNTLKRDLEPNIEDFYQEIKNKDYIAVIPVMKPKFKPVTKVENRRLHKLVAAFEHL